jgi:hypothetical protein
MDKPTPFTAQVPKHIIKAIKKEAKRQNMKMYQVVSLALVEWLDRHGPTSKAAA